VDKDDVLWHKVANSSGDSGWIESENLGMGEAARKNQKKSSKNTISKRTSKQRRMYVKDNPDLDRRFKKFIKEGFVGMGMNRDNVQASLGDPDIKRTVFLMDRGQLPVWIYNPDNPTVILFDNDIVKGWSKE